MADVRFLAEGGDTARQLRANTRLRASGLMLARTRWFNKTIAYLTLLSCRDRRPGWFGGLASLSADAPAGGTAGVSSHANTIHHVHTGAACFADFNEQFVRLMEGCGWKSLCRWPNHICLG